MAFFGLGKVFGKGGAPQEGPAAEAGGPGGMGNDLLSTLLARQQDPGGAIAPGMGGSIGPGMGPQPGTANMIPTLTPDGPPAGWQPNIVDEATRRAGEQARIKGGMTGEPIGSMPTRGDPPGGGPGMFQPPPNVSTRTPPAWQRWATGQKMQEAVANNWQPNPMMLRLLGNK